MELTGIGGGIMVAIAAALWLVYLLPTWLKRREYLATERNAVRLQQTIRVLAETTERPMSMRLDEARPRIPNGPVAVGRPVVLPAHQDPRVLASHRLRRTRALTALVLLAAVVVAIVQVGFIIGSGAVAASWLILGTAGLVVICSVAMLGRLAEVSRARQTATAPVARRRTSLGHRPLPVPVAGAQQQWTPVAVPKPLYLDRPDVVAPAVAAAVELERKRAAAAAELIRAAAAAEEALRTVQASAPPLRAGERTFASMGIIDDDATQAPDLDAMIARRRIAG